MENNILVNEFLEFYRELSKHKAEEVSSLLYKERINKFRRNKKPLYEGQSKAFPEDRINELIEIEDNQKARLCYIIMANMGLRISEVIQIKINDIKENWELEINNVKCKRKEFMIIPKSIRNEIEEYKNKYKYEIANGKNYLFYSIMSNRDHISKDWLRNQFRKKIKIMRLNKVYGKTNESKKDRKERELNLYTTHSLRHYFCKKFYRFLKECKDEDIKIELTRISMRHTDINSTLVYLRENNSRVNEILEVM